MKPRTAHLIVAALLAVYAGVYLHIYDNWRFVIAGDTLGYAEMGFRWAAGGAPTNPWDQQPVVVYVAWPEAAWINWPMVLFGATDFWHHVGKLSLVLTAAAALYVYFSTLIGAWALLPIALLLVNNYWLAVSVGHMAHQWSLVTAPLTCALAVHCWRRPRSWLAPIALGAVAGMATWVTRTAWLEVAGALVVAAIVLRRRIVALGLMALTAIGMAWPVLVQWPQVLANTRWAMGTAPRRDWASLLQTATMAAVNRPRWHDRFCGDLWWNGLFTGGVALAVLSLLPGLRTWLRLDRCWALILGQLMIVAGALAVAQPYVVPSQNRIYHLLPLQLFLMAVPLVWVGQWSPPVAVLLAIALLAVVTPAMVVRAVWCPSAPVGGGNIYDSLIEMTQKHGEITLVTSARPDVLATVRTPGAVLNRLYHLDQRVWIANDLGCGGRIRCTTSRDTALLSQLSAWPSVPVQSGRELICGRAAP